MSRTVAFAVVPKVTGGFSLVGSCFILRDILRKRQMSMISLIMLNLSIADVASSFFMHFMSTWMVPSSTPPEYVAFAAGNQATCSMQGFMATLFFPLSNFLNVSLAAAYYLSICRQWSDTRLTAHKMKFLFLGVPWILCLAYAIWLATEFGYRFNMLWYCGGGSKLTFLLATIFGTLIFAAIVGSVVALILFVYRADRQMDRYLSQGQANNRKNTIQVTMQGIWFAAAYIVVAVPNFVLFWTSVPASWYWLVYACIVPLQGLLNAAVYFRPRYIRERKRHSHESRLISLARVLGLSTGTDRGVMSQRWSLGMGFRSSMPKRKSTSTEIPTTRVSEAGEGQAPPQELFVDEEQSRASVGEAPQSA